MGRAIFRWSLNGGATGSARNETHRVLNLAGFEQIGTGAREADGVPIEELIDSITAALDSFKKLPKGTTLDHVWLYLDEEEKV